MSRRRCALQCEGKARFFSLPKDEHVKNQWLKFIFTMIPQQYNPKLLLCSLYFADDCFSNLGVQCRIHETLERWCSKHLVLILYCVGFLLLANSRYHCLTDILLLISCGPLLPKTVSINADCLSFSLL
ncbi:hypothetical protein PO909_011040 [Leuciscus waleckii]